MKKMVYDEAEIKRFTAPMEEPMRHQIQDAMNLKIPKEYIQVLVNKKFNFYSRAYLIGCILDQESMEGIQQLEKKKARKKCAWRDGGCRKKLSFRRVRSSGSIKKWQRCIGNRLKG